MNTNKLRVLTVAVLVIGATGLFALALSSNASAASLAGTWVSREAGRGYTQTYMGPYGVMVTEYFDIELTLSGEGSSFSGTLTSTGYGYTQSYPVEGTFDGTTFLMTAYYGWDGVSFLTPEYTLTVSGSEMFGSGSYLNVGVTIYGTFDLKKEGLFGVGGIAPIASGAAIAVSIVAIVVAATPPRVAPAPKGFSPQTTRVPSPPPRYEPSQQWTTEVSPQPIYGDQTVPVGGVGLTQGVSVRPMTEAERGVVRAIPKPHRNNAIGMAMVAMVMAVMVNFVEDEIALVMPLFFSFVGLGLAVQARKGAGMAGKVLAGGTVIDYRGTPRWTKTGGCSFGTFSVLKSGQLRKLLPDGVPATLTMAPEAKRLLAVNGMTLRSPATLAGPVGFEATLVTQASAEASRGARARVDDDLPPPPDDWQASGCPSCGKEMNEQARFCQNCGHERGTKP